MRRRIMLISTALLLDSNIRNSVCTPAKLLCRRVVEGNNKTKKGRKEIKRGNSCFDSRS
jgi:hypothetical protein